MLGSPGSPTPYQFPTKFEVERGARCWAGAALASGSKARNPNAAKHAMGKCAMILGAIRTIGEIEFHHPMADEDVPLRVHTDAALRVGQHDDLVIRLCRCRGAVDLFSPHMFDVARDRPGARFRLIADEVAIVAFAEFFT